MCDDLIVGGDAERREDVPLVPDVIDHVGVVVGIHRADPLVHQRAALSGVRLQRRRRKNLLEIGDDRARLVEREIAMLQDRHPVERVQRKMGRGAHIGFEIAKIIGHAFVRQHQAHDVDKAAGGKAEQSQVGHGFLSNGVCPQLTAETGAGREDACPTGKSRSSAPPEGLVGFSQSLFLCDADVLEQVKVAAFGNLAQRPALARPGEPSDDCRARAGEEPADRRFRIREGARGDINGEQRAGIWYGHASAPNLVPGRGLADRTEPDQ